LLIIKSKQQDQRISVSTSDPGYHIVDSEETLYGISKQYAIDLEKLKDWNQINGNEVRIGDTLLIKPPLKRPVTAVTNSVAKPVKVGKSGEAKPVQEHGIAAVIDGSSDTKKYLALHPTAPYGTIMKVRNELTNLSVFVRVVGALPATGANNNILIRLSPAAQEALGALDNKFRVELSYVSP
jgi:LysM repeat protein